MQIREMMKLIELFIYLLHRPEICSRVAVQVRDKKSIMNITKKRSIFSMKGSSNKPYQKFVLVQWMPLIRKLWGASTAITTIQVNLCLSINIYQIEWNPYNPFKMLSTGSYKVDFFWCWSAEPETHSFIQLLKMIWTCLYAGLMVKQYKTIGIQNELRVTLESWSVSNVSYKCDP
jgi:hypothetical protein